MKAIRKPLKIMALALALLGISILFLLSSPVAPSEEKEIVSVEKNPQLAAHLGPLGLDRLFEWEGRVYILAGPQDLQSLDRSGIPYLFESYKFPALNTKPVTLQSGINGDYHSYSELEADLQALERAHPQTARLFTIGQTLEGRNIYALKISDNAALDEDEAEVLFVGCHHAREWISVEVPFLLGKYLLDHYTTDADVRKVVNESEVWIVPLVNPDGLEYSIRYYRYWRKNRRLNTDGSFGVDINRNYDYAWGYDNEGSSPEPASDIYRGSAPFSEPETQAIRDFFGQREFQALVSYHSYSQVILYPWGYTPELTDQNALHESLAAAMSALIEEVNGRVYAFGPSAASLYLTNGDTTDWAFGISGIPAYTIELPPIDQLDGGFFNAEKDIDPIFRENLPAALYLIDWSILNFTASPAATREAREGSVRGRTNWRSRFFR
jgi:carboxypeptidase T